jgi:hypothetical protein
MCEHVRYSGGQATATATARVHGALHLTSFLLVCLVRPVAVSLVCEQQRGKEMTRHAFALVLMLKYTLVPALDCSQTHAIEALYKLDELLWGQTQPLVEIVKHRKAVRAGIVQLRSFREIRADTWPWQLILHSAPLIEQLRVLLGIFDIQLVYEDNRVRTSGGSLGNLHLAELLLTLEAAPSQRRALRTPPSAASTSSAHDLEPTTCEIRALLQATRQETAPRSTALVPRAETVFRLYHTHFRPYQRWRVKVVDDESRTITEDFFLPFATAEEVLTAVRHRAPQLAHRDAVLAVKLPRKLVLDSTHSLLRNGLMPPAVIVHLLPHHIVSSW